MCSVPVEQRAQRAQEIVQGVIARHSRTLDRGDFSDVPLAGVVNDVAAIFSNDQWAKFQGREGRPNYLVVNMTREEDAPGFAAALTSGRLPYLKAEVCAAVEAGMQLFRLLPHVSTELQRCPKKQVGCSNVYANFYGEQAGMGEHLDGSPGQGDTVLWARGVEKLRLPKDPQDPQALVEDIGGTQYGLIGCPVGDPAYEVQLAHPPGSLTLNGARALKYGQANIYHRFQVDAQAVRGGPIVSVQVNLDSTHLLGSLHPVADV